MSWDILPKAKLQYLLTRLKEVFDKKANVGVYYGTCSTDKYTAEKAVVVSADQEFVLKTGVVVNVMFANSNSSSTNNVTINVNNTGAKSIYYDDAVYTSSGNKVCGHKDRVTTYMYNGTYWAWIGSGIEYDTTYSAISTADIVAGTSSSEKVVRADYLKAGIDQLIAAASFIRGHIIKNDSGTDMTTRQNLQFQGTYVSDDSTNDKTVVPIVRSMQQADFDLLSSDEKTGLIDVTNSGYTPSPQTRLLDLSDCSIILPVNGQILKYDSTTNKWVNSDNLEIVNNLTTNDATKVLSAAQGKVLKDDQYYKSGDTVSVYYGDTFAGRIGWAGKILIFYVPLTKKLGSGIQSITDNITHIYICSASEAKSASCPNDTSVVTKEIFYREGWLTFRYTFVNVPTSSALDAGCNVMIGGSNWGSHFDITFN